MPYELKKVKGGWKVQKKDGELTSTGKRYFSNTALSKEKATAQMRAHYASEGRTSPTRKTKPSSRKKVSSPRRTTKSPTRRRKPTSPIRIRKRQKSPKPKKRLSSPKYKRK